VRARRARKIVSAEEFADVGVKGVKNMLFPLLMMVLAFTFAEDNALPIVIPFAPSVGAGLSAPRFPRRRLRRLAAEPARAMIRQKRSADVSFRPTAALRGGP
jgi:hypothetical protein